MELDTLRMFGALGFAQKETDSGMRMKNVINCTAAFCSLGPWEMTLST